MHIFVEGIFEKRRSKRRRTNGLPKTLMALDEM
jgi:hypothetical protein